MDRRSRNLKLNHEFAAFEDCPSWPGRKVFNRDFALSRRSGDHNFRLAGNQGGYRVSSRRGVTEIARKRGAPLNLSRTDQIRGLGHSGPKAPNRLVLKYLGCGHRCTQRQAFGVERGRHQTGNPLDVDKKRRCPFAHSHLDQEVGSAGQNSCALLGLQKCDCVSDRCRGFVSGCFQDRTPAESE